MSKIATDLKTITGKAMWMTVGHNVHGQPVSVDFWYQKSAGVISNLGGVIVGKFYREHTLDVEIVMEGAFFKGNVATREELTEDMEIACYHQAYPLLYAAVKDHTTNFDPEEYAKEQAEQTMAWRIRQARGNPLTLSKLLAKFFSRKSPVGVSKMTLEQVRDFWMPMVLEHEREMVKPH